MERLQRLPLTGSCMVAADHAGSATIQSAEVFLCRTHNSGISIKV